MYEEAIMMLKDINGVLHKSVADALCLWAGCVGAQSALTVDVTDTEPGEKFHDALRILNEAGNIYNHLRAGLRNNGEQGSTDTGDSPRSYSYVLTLLNTKKHDADRY